MQKKLFVCDDHISILQVVRDIFLLEGYQVITCQSPENILSRIIEEKPDVVLMDLIMPKVHGDQIIKEIRKENGTAAIPVVVFSADLKGEERALSAGANAFIAKPFDVEELIQLVNSYS